MQQVFASKGLHVTIDILDRKMRNLKHSFKTIKNNNQKSTTGRGRIQWEWYETMEDIFLEDRTINIGHTLASLPSTSIQQQNSVMHNYENMKMHNNENMNMETETETSNIDQPETSSISTCEENNNLDSQHFKSSNILKQKSKIFKTRKSRELYELRKIQADSEKERVEAINKLRTAIEENNRIQSERNKLLEALIELERDKK